MTYRQERVGNCRLLLVRISVSLHTTLTGRRARESGLSAGLGFRQLVAALSAASVMSNWAVCQAGLPSTIQITWGEVCSTPVSASI